VRVVIVLIILLVVALYFTIGIRIGFLFTTPVYLINAEGVNHYYVNSEPSNPAVVVFGECSGQAGLMRLQLFDPAHHLVSSQRCGLGNANVSMRAPNPAPGTYELRVSMLHYNGNANLEFF
jgi:hypothetical protein